MKKDPIPANIDGFYVKEDDDDAEAAEEAAVGGAAAADAAKKGKDKKGKKGVKGKTGGVEGEMTVTRLADDHFYLVSAAVGELKDREFMATHWPAGLDATLTMVSEAFGVLAVAGPRSRDLLARCTDADVSNDAFPWLTAQCIAVCGVGVRARRGGGALRGAVRALKS